MEVKLAKCAHCGNYTDTVEFGGVPLCFDCAEEPYQALAANESTKLSRRWAL